MKIHHIGIIVDDIEKNIEIYRCLGYKPATEIMIDDVQHIRIIFLRSSDDTQTIELIESLGSISTVHNFRAGYHHICYDVSDMPDFISRFKKMKIGKIFTMPIVSPKMGNRQTVFACLNNGLFVEFFIN